jgi:hypothetical protein
LKLRRSFMDSCSRTCRCSASFPMVRPSLMRCRTTRRPPSCSVIRRSAAGPVSTSRHHGRAPQTGDRNDGSLSRPPRRSGNAEYWRDGVRAERGYPLLQDICAPLVQPNQVERVLAEEPDRNDGFRRLLRCAHRMLLELCVTPPQPHSSRFRRWARPGHPISGHSR